MTESHSRHRESLSAVAASAADLAAHAAQTAASAMDVAARKVDQARDRSARRRDPKAVHLRVVRSARRRTTGWTSSVSATAVVSAAGFAAAAPDLGAVAAG
ncbi:hypothetical protein [Tsukamurella soli]|uniref:hypothetical protein n=2 Tax=Tsukamurella soli TaxID=644556 RepID=UPI00361E94CB